MGHDTSSDALQLYYANYVFARRHFLGAGRWEASAPSPEARGRPFRLCVGTPSSLETPNTPFTNSTCSQFARMPKGAHVHTGKCNAFVQWRLRVGQYSEGKSPSMTTQRSSKSAPMTSTSTLPSALKTFASVQRRIAPVRSASTRRIRTRAVASWTRRLARATLSIVAVCITHHVVSFSTPSRWQRVTRSTWLPISRCC